MKLKLVRESLNEEYDYKVEIVYEDPFNHNKLEIASGIVRNVESEEDAESELVDRLENAIGTSVAVHSSKCNKI